MHRHARFLLLMVLAVGTAVFGGTLAILARSGPLDPRAALAGILAATGLTAALLGLVWARYRTEGSTGDTHKRTSRPTVQADPAVAVIPLGEGRAAIIFDEAPTHPRSPLGATLPPRPGPETAAAADAIWNAVTAVVAEFARTANPPPERIPNRPANLPRSARSWARRLRHGLRRQDPGR